MPQQQTLNSITHPRKHYPKKVKCNSDMLEACIRKSYIPNSKVFPISAFCYDVIFREAKRTWNKYPANRYLPYTKGFYILQQLNRKNYLQCIRAEQQILTGGERFNQKKLDIRVAISMLRTCLSALDIKRGAFKSTTTSNVFRAVAKYGIKKTDIMSRSIYLPSEAYFYPEFAIAYVRTGESPGHAFVALLKKIEVFGESIWGVMKTCGLGYLNMEANHFSPKRNNLGMISEQPISSWPNKNAWVRAYPVRHEIAFKLFERLDQREISNINVLMPSIIDELKNQNIDNPEEYIENGQLDQSTFFTNAMQRDNEFLNKNISKAEPYSFLKWNCHSFANFCLALLGIYDPYLSSGVAPKSDEKHMQKVVFGLDDNGYWATPYCQWYLYDSKEHRIEDERGNMEETSGVDLNISISDTIMDFPERYYKIASSCINSNRGTKISDLIYKIIINVLKDYEKSHFSRGHVSEAKSIVEKLKLSKTPSQLEYLDIVQEVFASKLKRFNTRCGGGSMYRRLAFCSAVPGLLPDLLRENKTHEREILKANNAISGYLGDYVKVAHQM